MNDFDKHFDNFDKRLDEHFDITSRNVNLAFKVTLGIITVVVVSVIVVGILVLLHFGII